MAAIAVLARLAFWVTGVYIVGHAVGTTWQAGDVGLAALMALFFPLTYFVYPWTAGLGGVLVLSIAAYAVSNLAGARPID